MKDCSAWREELAAAASLGETPNPAVAAHLRECAQCRDAYSAFRRVAAAHHEAATRLPGPNKPARLESWFQSQITPGSRRFTWLPGWRALTTALAASAVLAIGLSFLNRERNSAAPDKSPQRAIADTPSALGNDRTWQSFRREALMEEKLAEMNFPKRPAVMTHYRLKDASLVLQ